MASHQSQGPGSEKENSPPNAPPRFLSWQRERSTVLVTCLGKQKKRWEIHSVPNTFSPGFWRILDVQDKESWVQMRWCNEKKQQNTSTAVQCAWNLQGKFKCAMVVLWVFRGCKLINVFLSQQECKQNCCLHQMLEGWRVDILHNIPNGMTQIWKSWTMKGLFDLRV